MNAILELYPWLTNKNLLISQLLSGINSGVLVSLVALGISLIFGVGKIINLAHGSFYMLGAYMMSSLCKLYESVWWFFSAAFTAALIVGLISGVIEFFLLRKIYEKGAHLQIMLTFGILLCINTMVEIIWGTDFRTIERPEALSELLQIGTVTTPKYNITLTIGGIVILIFFWLLVKKTKWGHYIRASSYDREMLGVLGINIKMLSTMVFMLASALAGLAGALSGPLFAVNLQMGIDSSLNSFIVVVVGGLSNILGTLIAAFSIGIIQSYSILAAPKIAGFIPCIIMLVSLVVRYGKTAYVNGLQNIEETKN